MVRLKKAVRGMARFLYKIWILRILYPMRYRRYAAHDIKEKKILFLEVRESELSDDFRLLWKCLEEKGGYELKLRCLREGMEGRAAVRKRCLSALKDAAEAEFIFISDSCYFLSALPLRRETKVIQVWHACGAFKKFGYSTADKKFGAGRFGLKCFPVHRNFSCVTVSSPEVAWAYAEAFHMQDTQDRILPLGISRTDVFFQADFENAARTELYEKIPSARGKKILLYAPTFRGKVAYASSPDYLDLAALYAELGEEWIVLCKHHPFVKKRPEIPEACRDFAFDVTTEISISRLLAVSDVCISDYSSLIFEYSLFERPMIFLVPDLEEYYDWRGFYYPFEELAPGPVVQTTQEVAAYIRNLPECFDREKVIRFRKKFMSACDGHATERILGLLEKKSGKEDK